MELSDPTQQKMQAGDIERAGRRFAADMKALREARGVSLDAIRQDTRLAEGILDEFESTGLTTNEMFNRVYLRSLVISYAKVVGLDQSVCLAALEAALAGVYDGELAVVAQEDGGDDEGVPASPRDSASATVAEYPEEGDGPHRKASLQAEDEDQESSTTSDEPPVSSEDSAAEPWDRVARRFVFVSSDEHARAPRSAANPATSRVKTEISTAVHGFVEPESQKGVIVPPNRFRAVALGSLAIIVSITALVMAFRLSSRTQSGSQERDALATTTDVAPEREMTALPPDPIPAAQIVTIGDSITVTLVATGGPLDPVRVQVDSDLRRPYWVDEGDSMSFKVVRRIAIQDLLDRLSLRLEGVPYPIDSYTDSERVIITRDSVEAFVRSLASR
jgi:hypothetical protein